MPRCAYLYLDDPDVRCVFDDRSVPTGGMCNAHQIIVNDEARKATKQTRARIKATRQRRRKAQNDQTTGD